MWQPLSGVCVSDAFPDDAVGKPDFKFAPTAEQDIVRRNDGPLFELSPGARDVIIDAYNNNVRLAVASWNHVGNIERILTAFGLRDKFSQVVAEWHTDKASMLRKIMAAEEKAGREFAPADVLFVDDDPSDIYRAQAAGLGINFAKMGHPEEASDWQAVKRLVYSL